MKLKNESAKVIGVLGTDLMPDGEMEVTEDVVKHPVISTFIKMRLLSVDDAAEKAEREKSAQDEAFRLGYEQAMKELAAKKDAAGESDMTAEEAEAAKAPAEKKPTKKATKVAAPAAE